MPRTTRRWGRSRSPQVVDATECLGVVAGERFHVQPLGDLDDPRYMAQVRTHRRRDRMAGRRIDAERPRPARPFESRPGATRSSPGPCHFVGPRVLTPAVIAVLVFGVLMVLESAASDFGQTSVLLAIAGFALAFVIGGLFFVGRGSRWSGGKRAGRRDHISGGLLPDTLFGRWITATGDADDPARDGLGHGVQPGLSPQRAPDEPSPRRPKVAATVVPPSSRLDGRSLADKDSVSVRSGGRRRPCTRSVGTARAGWCPSLTGVDRAHCIVLQLRTDR